jgi:hypothetical protein
MSQAPPLLDQAQFALLQATVCSNLACVLSKADVRPLDERAADVARLLNEDETRVKPLLTLSSELESGGLLLTAFLKFLGAIIVHNWTRRMARIDSFDLNMPYVQVLLSRPPLPDLLRHPEERGALTLFASLFAAEIDMFGGNWTFTCIRSLVRRGSDINARNELGFTPLQSWCLPGDIASTGILLLLELGADLDAPHPSRHTALYQLCIYLRVQMLRDLANAGWLVSANLDMIGYNNDTITQMLERMLHRRPSDTRATEMVDILSTQRRIWREARPTVLAELTAHESLIPDLAELIVSFIDRKD